MRILGQLLLIALQLYMLAMWGRLILDWVRVFAPHFRPRGALLVIAEVLYTITDPALKLVRRWVKPIRVGPVAIDVAWVIVMLALAVVSFVVRRIFVFF